MDPVARSKPIDVDRSKSNGVAYRDRVGFRLPAADIDAAPTGGRADWLARRAPGGHRRRPAAVGSTLPASRVLAADLRFPAGWSPRPTSDSPTTATSPDAAARHHRHRRTAGRLRRGPDRRRPTARRAGPVNRLSDGDAMFAARRSTTPMFDRLRAAPARIDLTPGAPDLAAFPRAGVAAGRTVGAVSDRRRRLRLPGPAGALDFRRSIAGLARPQPGHGRRPGRRGGGRRSGAGAWRCWPGSWAATGIESDRGGGPRVAGRQATTAELGHRHPAGGGRRAGTAGRRNSRDADVPAVLLTPAHQFPTGVVLDGGRRRELLDWAAGGGLIIEDDYDAEHRYDRPPTPALFTRCWATRSATRAASPSCWRRHCGWAGWWCRAATGRRWSPRSARPTWATRC